MVEPKIVVGVDGSPASLAALREALEEARLRHAQLQVVMVWQLTWSEIAIETPVVVQKIVEHNAQILEAALASIDHGHAAGVEVSSELVNGHPATALIDAASDATLLVVGTRGTSGITGTIIGSVAHAAIHHAKCPVLVVPPRGSEAEAI
jgi:nucleotide-binding universal stress UspA family protein